MAPSALEATDLFQRRMAFLGLVGVAFTCMVYLMTLLRPVLEPFLWALFLVTALHPLATLFEAILLGIGRIISCRCSRGPSLTGPPRRALPARRIGGGAQDEAESPEQTQGRATASTRVADDIDGDNSDSLWHVREPKDVESVCAGCCACASRVVSVACALAVVLAVASGLAMLVFEATIRVKENIAIYETGARNAVAEAKRVITHVFGRLPPSVVDEITENALSSGKAILSELLTSMLSYAGKILVGFAMLSLYVMFWLCTPMPLNSKTERIFRRYLILKGSACVCYGSAVGLLLYMLSVELAPVFGLISFFFSFIPEVGAFIAMMLPMPVILFDSRLEAPFLTLLTATAGQLSLKFVFSNIIEVKLVENDTTMKMHPVITLLAVTFFGFIWGPTGMLLSVPMMAYMKVVILSDLVPPAYRDPVLVLLEGDRKAPERHLRARMRAAPD